MYGEKNVYQTFFCKGEINCIHNRIGPQSRRSLRKRLRELVGFKKMSVRKDQAQNPLNH